MKKYLILLGLGVLAYTYKDKIFGTTAAADDTAGNTGITTDYNGNIAVSSDNGQWFVIDSGKRWFTANQQSIADYVAAHPTAKQLTLTEAQMSIYPISGGIYPGLDFH